MSPHISFAAMIREKGKTTALAAMVLTGMLACTLAGRLLGPVWWKEGSPGPSPSAPRCDRIRDSAELAHFIDTDRPRTLDLSLSRVTDAGLAPLRRAGGLRGLDLFGTEVGDAGLEHLAGLTELRGLYLESTRVRDAGLVNLRSLRKLETLALSGTRVSDAGLANLRGLSLLKAVDLSWTAVTPAGVEGLRRALPGTQITTEDEEPSSAVTNSTPAQINK